MIGKLFGVGVGPGDEELITVKALKTFEKCDIIAVPKTKNGETVAFNIIKSYKKYIEGKVILEFYMPMTKDYRELEKNYIDICNDMEVYLNEGKNIAFITLGDPTVYSTYMRINKIILERGYETELIPGITSFCASAARLNISLCDREEPLIILPASYNNFERSLEINGTKVIMKANRSVKKIRDILVQNELINSSYMVECCGMENEKVYLKGDLENLCEDSSYFSVIIVKEQRKD